MKEYKRISILEIEKDTVYLVELIERTNSNYKRNVLESFIANKSSETYNKVNELIKKYKLTSSVKIAVASPFYGYEQTTVKEWRE